MLFKVGRTKIKPNLLWGMRKEKGKKVWAATSYSWLFFFLNSSLRDRDEKLEMRPAA